ncbi:MAG: type II toxin-antitoxin system VapC family toxin [Caldilineaceae bacterium]
MQISLDTNIWLFGIVGADQDCETILLNLKKFNVIVPDQIREEVERNLTDYDMKQFYRFLIQYDISIDFALVPAEYIAIFEQKGLKKGDAEIGAFCEWRKIDIIVSENRDFLRGLSPDHYFEVMSAKEFCQKFGL